MEGTFIFVCDRGFVIVGKGGPSQDMPFAWKLTQSCTIRNWGTSNGLAELQDGPTSSTQVDVVCQRTLPHRSIIDIIHLTKKGIEAWHKAFKS